MKVPRRIRVGTAALQSTVVCLSVTLTPRGVVHALRWEEEEEKEEEEKQAEEEGEVRT